MNKILLSGLLLSLFSLASCSGEGTSGGKEISKEEAEEIIAKFKEIDLHQLNLEQTIELFADGSSTGEAIVDTTSAGFIVSAKYMVDDTTDDSYLLTKTSSAQYEGESPKKEDFNIRLMEVLKDDLEYKANTAQYGLSSSGSFECKTMSLPMSQEELNLGIKDNLEIAESMRYSEDMKQIMTEETIYTLKDGCLSLEVNLDKNSEFARNLAEQISPGLGYESNLEKLDTNVKIDFDENGYVTYAGVNLNIEAAVYSASSQDQKDILKLDASIISNAKFNEPFDKTARFETEKAAIDKELNNL